MDLRSSILSACHKPEQFSCKAVGVSVWLKRLTVEEAEEYFASADGKTPTAQLMLLIAAFCLCDEHGIRLFARPEDLKDMAYTALEAIALEAMRLNGFTEKAASSIKKKAEEASGTISPGNLVAPLKRPKRR